MFISSDIQVRQTDSFNSDLVPNWAAHLDGLWTCHLYDSFPTEMEYNQREAVQHPHCAICSLFSSVCINVIISKLIYLPVCLSSQIVEESDFSDTTYDSAYVNEVQSLIAKKVLCNKFSDKMFGQKI